MNGMMVAVIKVNLKMGLLKDMGFLNGRMEEFMKEISSKIK